LPARSVEVALRSSVPFFRPLSRTLQAPFASTVATAALARFQALALVAALSQVLAVAF
jgi:hypothetical protein